MPLLFFLFRAVEAPPSPPDVAPLEAEGAPSHRAKAIPVGGQALIEGVMMRSPNYVAAAVRKSDGSIALKQERLQSVAKRFKPLGWPFIRGVVGLFEMLAVGMRYLNWSSSMALEDENQAQGKPSKPEAAMPAWVFASTAVLSFGLGLGLFVALPHLIAGWTLGHWAQEGAPRAGTSTVPETRVLFNVFEGVVKLVIFVAYVWLVGRRKHIARVFEFHGAEHKVVYAVENNRPLTPEGARPFDTPHPRCGTGFALLTVLVSVLCFAFLPITDSSLLNVGMRFALMPVVAGVSYEIIKLTTHPRWGRFAVWVLTPGLWLQRLTTKQPDDSQLEVACAAMQAVLSAEGAETVAKPGMI